MDLWSGSLPAHCSRIPQDRECHKASSGVCIDKTYDVLGWFSPSIIKIRFSSNVYGSTKSIGMIPFPLKSRTSDYSREQNSRFCPIDTSLNAISLSNLASDPCNFMGSLMHQRKPTQVLSIFAWSILSNMYTHLSSFQRPRSYRSNV